jgi:phage terminase small subunit
MTLTLKQQFFVKHYLIERNAKKAAIAAGYSPDTAVEQGLLAII